MKENTAKGLFQTRFVITPVHLQNSWGKSDYNNDTLRIQCNRNIQPQTPCKIYAFTNNHAILNTLSLVWGVTGFYYDNETGTDETVADTKKD